MKPLLLQIALLLPIAAVQAQTADPVPELQQHVVIDMLVAQEKQDVPPTLRRYYAKDVRIVRLGERDFLIGAGALKNQAHVMIPVDRVVFIGGLGNIQDFSRLMQGGGELFPGK